MCRQTGQQVRPPRVDRLILRRDGLRWSAARDSGREELVPGRPVCRAAGAGFGSGRLEGAGHDRPGLLGSTEGGKTWAPLAWAPPLFLTAWADSKTIVGVTTQGSLAISADAGQIWKSNLATVTSGQAISASRDKASVLEILVVTDKGVLQSRDEGATLAS
jgi:photosystem II stability/assembly factor-like uncharacterized protein